MMLVVVALAGGVGAVARFLLDSVVRRRGPWAFPIGTLLVNAAGSLLLGMLYGWGHHGGSNEVLAVIGTGFCGGFTTFSTASVEAVQLRSDERPLVALFYAAGTLGCCLCLAWLGMLLGRSV